MSDLLMAFAPDGDLRDPFWIPHTARTIEVQIHGQLASQHVGLRTVPAVARTLPLRRLSGSPAEPLRRDR